MVLHEDLLAFEILSPLLLRLLGFENQIIQYLTEVWGISDISNFVIFDDFMLGLVLELDLDLRFIDGVEGGGVVAYRFIHFVRYIGIRISSKLYEGKKVSWIRRNSNEKLTWITDR